jgi:HNH endonuclease
MARPTGSLDERFPQYIELGSELFEGTPCHLWTGEIKPEGYGRFHGQFPDGSRRQYAHRWIYEQMHGPIPAGYEVDHLCHWPEHCNRTDRDCLHRRCVNVLHLAAVPPWKNLLRSAATGALNAQKTRCPQDHPYTPENTYIRPRGDRQCRICIKERVRRRYRQTP